MLIAYALLGVASAASDVVDETEMYPPEIWDAHLNEVSNLKELSRSTGKEDPYGFSYLDGPYPNAQDNGAHGTDPPDGLPMPWGSHFVSDIFVLDNFLYPPFDIDTGGGNFLLGDVHEQWIGDQNGNGLLEWVVFFYYLPWEEDGLDNDGDGCVDEKTGSVWDDPTPCDLVPDAAVIYETGGLPSLGGEIGDLFVNVDWYSDLEATEIYRAFVSPRWFAYRLRGIVYYPQLAGEFISYHAHEGINGVNANPEMDRDMSDMYVGSIDARMFPAKAPVNRACSAGNQFFVGITYQRNDGWVVTSYELGEMYDNHDWNGDGDKSDWVVAYYATDPRGGNCRLNAVNTGVVGGNPKNTGIILTPGYTFESSDFRDWNGDGDRFDTLNLYHEINSSWSLKGRVYRSFTFTTSVPTWGFGWWAVYNDYYQFQIFPLEFGGTYYRYVGWSGGYYNVFWWLVSDEDGNRHTTLPQHYLDIGQPSGTIAGRCVLISAREYYLEYAGVNLVGGIADGNGDGDTMDFLNYIFCPDRTDGGGDYIVEATSKFAKGLYQDPMPFIWLGYVYYGNWVVIEGTVLVPFFRSEYDLNDDCNGDLIISHLYCYQYYRIHESLIGGGIDDRKMPKGDFIGEREPVNSHESSQTSSIEVIMRV